MDFPPGDHYSPVIVNNTTSPVRVATCDDEVCTKLDHSDGVRVLPRKRTSALLASTFGGSRFVVLDAGSGERLGCLTPSWSSTGMVDHPRVLRTGAAAPCGAPPPHRTLPAWLMPVFAMSIVAATLGVVIAAANWLATRPTSTRGAVGAP
jgi:hypothetical protein